MLRVQAQISSIVCLDCQVVVRAAVCLGKPVSVSSWALLVVGGPKGRQDPHVVRWGQVQAWF